MHSSVIGRSQPERRDGGDLSRHDRNRLPLSFNQSTHLVLDWLSQLRGHGIPARPLAIARRLDGLLSTEALQYALSQLVRRHEVLRTAFPDPCRLSVQQQEGMIARLKTNDLSGSGLFTQTVVASSVCPLHLETLPAADLDSSILKERFRDEITRPFDYTAPPLMRAVVFSLGPSRALLLIVLHHLVADLWSLGVLWSELAQLYDRHVAGKLSGGLPDLSFQYGDFARREQQQYSRPLAAPAAAYWREQWQTYGGVRLRPSDLPVGRAADARGEPRWESLALDPALTHRARALAQQHRVTTYMLCVSAMAVLFHAYTGRRHLAWWGYCANRTSEETDALIGWFAQGRILGVAISPDDTARTVLAQVRSMVCEMARYEDTPLQLVWKLVNDHHAATAGALDDDFVSFNVATPPRSSRALADGVTVSVVPADLVTVQTTRALKLWAVEGADGVTGLACAYSSAQIDPAKISVLLRDLARVLTKMTDDADAPVAGLASHVALR